MTREEIRRIACQVVTDVLELEPGELQDDVEFDDALGADSLKSVGLVVALERQFEIQYAPGDAQQLHSIADVVRVTEKYVDR